MSARFGRYVWDDSGGEMPHAGYKARADVTRFAGEVGFEVIPYHGNATIARRAVGSLSNAVVFLRRARRMRSLLVQFPIGSTQAMLLRLLRIISRDVTVTFLIHDIESLRSGAALSREEASMFRLAHRIIVQTPAMRDWLAGHGFETDLILGRFDYGIEGEADPVTLAAGRVSVVFCGNLAKSGFLRGSFKVPDGVDFLGYGIGQEKLAQPWKWAGKFDPSRPPTFENESWGLIWDGPEVAACCGPLGEYLRYNAPHKLSLYLAMGLPVICWSRSAIADHVVSRGLGIVVDGLDDIGQGIASVCYETLRSNVRRASDEVRNGASTKRVLAQLMSSMEVTR
jgi:hypothetical protein